MDGFNESGYADEYDGLASKRDEKQIFRTFTPRDVAAGAWIKDLVENGYRTGKKSGRRVIDEEGFFMSDEMQEVGVLSIAPALSALLFELAQLKNGDDSSISKDAQPFEKTVAEKSHVLNSVTNSVCRLLAECYPYGVKDNLNDIESVLFSSMPFYDDKTMEENPGWESGGYLDTASWVFLVADSIEGFLNRLEHVTPEVYKKLKWEVKGSDFSEQLTTDEVKKAVRNLYLGSVKVTCDCIVRSGDKRDGRVLGWSFRRMEKGAEPSLYFSYVASTVYLGLHKRFDGGSGKISKLRAFEQELLYRAGQSEDALANEMKNFAFFRDITKPEQFKKKLAWLAQDRFCGYDEFKKFAEFLKELSADDKQELDLLYNYINKGQPLTYKFDEADADGGFSLLKQATVSLAEMLWNEGFGNSADKLPFKKHMAKGPCFQDGTPVDLSVVRQSNHNNSFFNNLFVIGIVLNSAYDEELRKKSPEEYGKMLNAFQLSIQNTQRCYGEIEEEGLLYKIDSYILDFAEKVDGESAELAKQLRKVNMAVVPLMPLLLKNNNLMNEYVVKYPQKEMKESLKDIIKNKKRDKDKRSIWVWDRDGYNAITNYYYIDSLIAFYRYYEKYEEVLIKNDERFNSRVNELVFKKEQEKTEALTSLENNYAGILAEKDLQISGMRSVLKGLARLVLNEMVDLVDEYLKPEKLFGDLTEDERIGRDKVVETLKSFDKDTDGVKISKLINITEKLQILSLLTMDHDRQIGDVIKSGFADAKNRSDSPNTVINNVLGKDGGSSDYMRNLILSLAAKPSSGNGGDDN